ncbi:MAG: TRAP transporter small permease [Betaproteobacteria bacterium]
MFLRLLDRLEEWLIATCMAVATLVIFVAVVHRYTSRIPALWQYTSQLDFSWAQELCIFLFIWMAKFGAAYGVRTGIHIGVDVLVTNSPPRIQRALIVTGLALGALVTAVIAILGGRWVMFMHDAGTVTADLEWPRWVVYLCIPLGSGLMSFRFMQAIWRYVTRGELASHDYGGDDAPATSTAGLRE